MLPSPFSIAWRSTFEQFFKSWSAWFKDLVIAALAILLAATKIGREEAMNDFWVLIYGPVAVLALAIVYFLWKWMVEWCERYDRKIVDLCPFRHVHEVADYGDDTYLSTSLFFVLGAAEFMEAEKSIQFRFVVHNGSVYTLSVLDAHGEEIGSPPRVTWMASEPVRLGQPKLYFPPGQLGPPFKHSAKFLIGIDVPVPDEVMPQMRDCIATSTRSAAAFFEFDRYVQVAFKAKESGRTYHVSVPNIRVVEANQHGLRVSMIPDFSQSYF